MVTRIARYLIIIGLCFHTVSVFSFPERVLYVDAEKGSDTNNGLSPEKAWKSLMYAAEKIQAGDHVKVAPGVYRGGIQLKAKGTPDLPIVIEGDAKEGSTIITLADADIRGGKQVWALEDQKIALYSTSYNGGPPARVLYSGTDLYPYVSVKALNAFTTSVGGPGPKHGYYFDEEEKKLYVRLYATGKYGSIDPNEHLMAVAPQTGGRFDGTLVSKSFHYGIGVIGAGDAHLVIKGFTFETPGIAGVYTEANYVKVSRSWFQGCRTGVVGNYKDRTTTDPEGNDYYTLRHDPSVLDLSASHVTIEYCDYHQKPTFEDALEMMEDLKAKGEEISDRDRYVSYWARKSVDIGLPSELYKYEIGIASRIGSDWIIRGNAVHDAFDGLSCHSVTASRGLRVEYNKFERLMDNGVESEDHSSDMHIHRNVFVDVFMPVSWQPIRGTPWPYSIYFTENIIYNTAENQDVWRETGFRGRGVFKIGVKAVTWKRIPHMVGTLYAPVTVPGDGLIFANNTILFPGGCLITVQGGRDMPVHNVNIINNIFDTEFLLNIDPEHDLKEDHFNFENNTVFFSRVNENGPSRIAAGPNGTIANKPSANSLDKNFKPLDGSSILNSAIPVPNLCKEYKNIGAIQPDGNWYPFVAGPNAKSIETDL